MKILLLTLGLIVMANCQIYNTTDYCVNYDINFNLQPELLLGDWYPIVVDTGFPYNLDCYKFNIYQSNSKILSYHTINLLNNNYWTHHLYATKTVNTFIERINSVRSLKTILDTDYTNYLVAIKCMESTEGLQYRVLILSRSMTLSDDLLLKLQNMILEKIGQFEFRRINFSSCS